MQCNTLYAASLAPAPLSLCRSYGVLVWELLTMQRPYEVTAYHILALLQPVCAHGWGDYCGSGPLGTMGGEIAVGVVP